MQEIYLDNASTTKVAKEVREYMLYCMEHYYANADSIHNKGLEVSKIINKEKEVFQKFGLDKKEIFFTAGGGEANNILFQAVAKYYKKGHIITTPIEHPSIMETCKNLKDYEVSYVKVDEYGRVDIENLLNLIREDTVLVSIAFVNSEVGTIQDIAKISDLVKKKNKYIYFHTDFVQGLGHVNVDFSKLKVDAISFSSHKIHGPKGMGALYISDRVKLKPIIYGSNTENSFIPRTMANELVLGFLKALSMLDDKDIEHMKKIKEYAIDELKKIKDIRINTPEISSPGIINCSVKNTKGEVIMNYLSSKGIYISTGSACSVKKGASRVIKELKIPKEYNEGAIRVSLSRYTTKDEIDTFIREYKNIINIMTR